MMIILHQKFISIAKYRHFIMYSFEYRRLHYSHQLCHVRHRKDV